MNENTKLLLNFNDDDFTSPLQLELYNYWLKVKGDRSMPARRDIHVHELKGMLPTLMMLDFNSVEKSIIFRLIGTECTKVYGEHTGRVLNLYPEHREAVKRLMWCVDNKKPNYGIKNLGNINKEYVKTSCIVLPLSDDGENVNKILVGHHFY